MMIRPKFYLFHARNRSMATALNCTQGSAILLSRCGNGYAMMIILVGSTVKFMPDDRVPNGWLMNGIFHVKSRKGGQTLTPPYAGKTGCGKPNAKTTGNAPDENRTRIGCTPEPNRK